MKESRLVITGMDVGFASEKEQRFLKKEGQKETPNFGEGKELSKRDPEALKKMAEMIESSLKKKDGIAKFVLEELAKTEKATKEEANNAVQALQALVEKVTSTPAGIPPDLTNDQALLLIGIGQNLVISEMQQEIDALRSEKAEGTQRQNNAPTGAPRRKTAASFKPGTVAYPAPEDGERSDDAPVSREDAAQIEQMAMKIDAAAKNGSLDFVSRNQGAARSLADVVTSARKITQRKSDRVEITDVEARQILELGRAIDKRNARARESRQEPKQTGGSSEGAQFNIPSSFDGEDFPQGQNAEQKSPPKAPRPQRPSSRDFSAEDRNLASFNRNRGLYNLNAGRNAKVQRGLQGLEQSMAQDGVDINHGASPEHLAHLARIQRSGGEVRNGGRYAVGPRVQPTREEDMYADGSDFPVRDFARRQASKKYGSTEKGRADNNVLNARN